MAEKAELSLSTSDLSYLVMFCPSGELYGRIRIAQETLKRKFKEMYGIAPDSPEGQEMMKNVRNWVSTDPKAQEQIRRANELYQTWTSMAVSLEFTKDELQAFVQNIGDWGGDAQETKKRLQAALSQL